MNPHLPVTTPYTLGLIGKPFALAGFEKFPWYTTWLGI